LSANSTCGRPKELRSFAHPRSDALRLTVDGLYSNSEERKRKLRRRNTSRGVHEIFQFLAGLKEGDFLRRHFHLGPGLGIPADPPPPLARAKTAEAANFDLVALLEGFNNALENRLDDRLGLLPGSSVTRRTSSMRSAFVNVGCLVIVPLPRRTATCRTRPYRPSTCRTTTEPPQLRDLKRFTGAASPSCPSSYH